MHPTRGAAWTSEDPAELAAAAEACAPCPVLDVCREAGRYEKWGAWGGIARGMTRAKRRPLRALALLSLASSPRPLTVDAVAAEIAPLLPEAVSRKRVSDALTRLVALGHASRHTTTPRTYTATPDGEATAACWLAEAEHRPR